MGYKCSLEDCLQEVVEGIPDTQYHTCAYDKKATHTACTFILKRLWEESQSRGRKIFLIHLVSIWMLFTLFLWYIYLFNIITVTWVVALEAINISFIFSRLKMNKIKTYNATNTTWKYLQNPYHVPGRMLSLAMRQSIDSFHSKGAPTRWEMHRLTQNITKDYDVRTEVSTVWAEALGQKTTQIP